MKLKGNRSALLLVIDQFVTVDKQYCIDLVRFEASFGVLMILRKVRVLYDLFLTEEIELKSASLSLKTFDTG